MSGKYMKIRKIVVPSITCLVIVSQMMLVSGCSSKEAKEFLDKTPTEITIEVAVPNFEEKGTESSITWCQLGYLTNYNGFRTEFDNAFGVKKVNDIKVGSMYIDSEGKATQNSTLAFALNNKVFRDKIFSSDEILNIVTSVYADIDEESGAYTKQAALVNAYFNLLNDNEKYYFNGGESLTRAEAMTLVMRATTPVENEAKPVENKEFKEAVTEENSKFNDYIDYAGYENENAYINTKDKSLNKSTFDGAMSRAEYIYLVMNTVGKDLKLPEITGESKIELRDCKEKKVEISGDYGYANELNKEIQNPDEGLDSKLYEAIYKAASLKIIGTDTEWDTAITREDAVNILINAMLQTEAKQNTDGFSELKAEYEKDGKEAYEKFKSDLDCTEEQFVETYTNHRFSGLEKKPAEEKSLMEHRRKLEPESEEIGKATGEGETTVEEETKGEELADNGEGNKNNEYPGCSEESIKEFEELLKHFETVETDEEPIMTEYVTDENGKIITPSEPETQKVEPETRKRRELNEWEKEYGATFECPTW